MKLVGRGENVFTLTPFILCAYLERHEYEPADLKGSIMREAGGHARLQGWLLLVVTAALLGGCGRSRTIDFQIEAHARVDGRPVVASTLWRINVADAFPQGAQIEGHGVALAIPVAPKHYIYGLFRAISGDTLTAWDVLPTGIDTYVRAEDRKVGREQFLTGSVSRYHDYAIGRLLNRSIDICLPDGQAMAGQNRCAVFIYFDDPTDPASVRMIRPGEDVVIAGRRVTLARITAGYRALGGTATSSESDLPDFIRNGRGVALGSLPKGVLIDSARQLHERDFRR